MRRALGLVFVFVLLLPGVGSLSSSGSSPATAPAFPIGSVVAFVDNKIVDLMWDPVAGAQRYKLYRNPGATIDPLPNETLAGKLFSRVTAETSGADASYRVCAVLADSSEDCSSWEIVHHEWVKGALYKNQTWSGEIYQLDGLVQVMDGARLTITNWATVSPMPTPSANPVIMTMLDGHLVIGGAGPAVTIRNISINHNSARIDLSEIRGEEGNLVKLEGVQVSVSTALSIKYGDWTNSKITVAPTTIQVSRLEHNTFSGSQIVLRGGVAEIAFNEFKGSPISAIDVAGS